MEFLQNDLLLQQGTTCAVSNDVRMFTYHTVSNGTAIIQGSNSLDVDGTAWIDIVTLHDVDSAVVEHTWRYLRCVDTSGQPVYISAQ